MRMKETTASGLQPTPQIHAGDWLRLGLLALIWGSGFMLMKVAVRDLPPATITLLRAGLASVMLLGVLRLRRVHLLPRTWAAWRPYWILGLLNMALPFTLNAWGLVRIESSLAGILTATVPVFTVAMAHFRTHDEQMTAPKALGVALGLAGVVAIIGLEPGVLTSGSGLGKLAVLLASFSYAISSVYARSLHGVPPLTTATSQMLAATAILCPVALLGDRPWEATWSAEALLAVLVLTVFGTTIGYLLYFRLLAGAGATNASLVAYLIPIVAVILGTTVLDEQLKPQHVIGMALIIASMAVIDGRLVRKLARRRALQPADT